MLATVCGNALRGGSSRAKAWQRSDGSSPMEGTSGAADFGSLRGDSGEAALGRAAGA